MRLRNPSVSNGVRSICSALPLSNLTPGKLAQFVFGAVIPISNPNAILATIAMAGVVEAGAWQACQQFPRKGILRVGGNKLNISVEDFDRCCVGGGALGLAANFL